MGRIAMQYRKMGSSDLEVSVIGFGCWEIGGRYGHFDEQEVIQAVHRAIELGVTLFDTALAYGAGKSEELLGRALGSKRKDVIVVTKGALPTRERQKPKRDARYASIMQDVEDSLRALKMDHVDLYLQHWPDPETPIEESMRALEEIRTLGKARYVGVSNFHPDMLVEAKNGAPIVTNQVGYTCSIVGGSAGCSPPRVSSASVSWRTARWRTVCSPVASASRPSSRRPIGAAPASSSASASSRLRTSSRMWTSSSSFRKSRAISLRRSPHSPS